MIIDDARHLVPLGDLDPVADRVADGCRAHAVSRDPAPLQSKLVPGRHRGGHRRGWARPCRHPDPAGHFGRDGDRRRPERGEARPRRRGRRAPHGARRTRTPRSRFARSPAGRGPRRCSTSSALRPRSTRPARWWLSTAASASSASAEASCRPGSSRRRSVSRCARRTGDSRSELREVLDLARVGAVTVHTEVYGLDDAVQGVREAARRLGARPGRHRPVTAARPRAITPRMRSHTSGVARGCSRAASDPRQGAFRTARPTIRAGAARPPPRRARPRRGAGRAGTGTPRRPRGPGRMPSTSWMRLPSSSGRIASSSSCCGELGDPPLDVVVGTREPRRLRCVAGRHVGAGEDVQALELGVRHPARSGAPPSRSTRPRRSRRTAGAARSAA